MTISVSEIFLITVIAFLVIKPERLPEVAAAIGKSLRVIRSTWAHFKKTVFTMTSHDV